MTAPRFTFAEVEASRWLAELDPRLKLAWLAWVSTLSVLLDATAALAGLFALALAGLVGLRLRPGAWLIVAALMLTLAWGTLLSQALFYAQQPRTILFTLVPPFEFAGWQFSGLAFYREGALYGLAQSLRILAVMAAGLSVCLSTSPERLLAALGKLRVPIAVGFTTVTALRFLPLVLAEVTSVRQARRLRGYRSPWRRALLSPARFKQAVGGEVALFLPVLSAALRRAAALSTSVTSRGFDPLARRTYWPELRFRPLEVAALASLASIWIALTAAKLLYWLYLAELYYHPGLRELYDTVRTWL